MDAAHVDVRMDVSLTGKTNRKKVLGGHGRE